MRLLSNLHVKGKPVVLSDRAIRRQSHYFIYRPRVIRSTTNNILRVLWVMRNQQKYLQIPCLLWSKLWKHLCNLVHHIDVRYSTSNYTLPFIELCFFCIKWWSVFLGFCFFSLTIKQRNEIYLRGTHKKIQKFDSLYTLGLMFHSRVAEYSTSRLARIIAPSVLGSSTF